VASNTAIIRYKPNKSKPQYVLKKIKPKKAQFTYYIPKEIEALNLLKDSGRVPHVIKVTRDSILMTYVGRPITRKTLPQDWKAQVEDILQKLAEVDISHNDIQSEEILVLSGKLYLIDFQHWTFGRAAFEEKVKSGEALNRVRLTDKEALYSCINNILGVGKMNRREKIRKARKIRRMRDLNAASWVQSVVETPTKAAEVLEASFIEEDGEIVGVRGTIVGLPEVDETPMVEEKSPEPTEEVAEEEAPPKRRRKKSVEAEEEETTALQMEQLKCSNLTKKKGLLTSLYSTILTA